MQAARTGMAAARVKSLPAATVVGKRPERAAEQLAALAQVKEMRRERAEAS
jgi:hypothetical protein